jgi:hypothetical protein
VTFDTLPDHVIQDILGFCLSNRYWNPIGHMKEWQRLVHVCRRWRQIIYGSPSYFDLHLYCSDQTPFLNNLCHWPEFPLTVRYVIPHGPDPIYDHDLLFALQCIDRVRRIELVITNSEVYDVFAAMQESFPALTHLDLTGHDHSEDFDDGVIDLPYEFIEGSAPSLQHLRLDAISCPTLPALLSSAPGLVSLQLEDFSVGNSGYISPEGLVGALTGLACLGTLCIKFPFWRDPPAGVLQDHPGPPTHAVLPALTRFIYRGECDYLEVLVAHIDTPRVEDVQIEYLTPEIEAPVEARQLSQLIGRTENFGFARFRRAQITFDFWEARIKLDRAQGEECDQAQFSLTVRDAAPLEKLESPVPRMVRVLDQLSIMVSNVAHLSINVENHGKRDRMDNTKWLPFLRLFPAVEALHVSGRLAGYFATVLEDIAEERATDVLSALRLLRLGDGDELVGSADQFLSWRQCTGRPVTVVKTQGGLVEWFEDHRRREEN